MHEALKVDSGNGEPHHLMPLKALIPTPSRNCNFLLRLQIYELPLLPLYDTLATTRQIGHCSLARFEEEG